MKEELVKKLQQLFTSAAWEIFGDGKRLKHDLTKTRLAELSSKIEQLVNEEEPVKENVPLATLSQLQMAAVLLLSGTEEQQKEALEFISKQGQAGQPLADPNVCNGFNISPPPLRPGDVYRYITIDEANQRVEHHARSTKYGTHVIYFCDKDGKFLSRQEYGPSLQDHRHLLYR